MIKGMTINDATHKWVSEFNAIPQSMIERLMRAAPDEWEELTLPRAGSRVHVFALPDSCDTLEHLGEIVAYAADLDKYRVDLDGGPSILVEPDNLEVVDEALLPMWGTMWSFGDSCDDYWLEYADGVQVMSDCGFRVYQHEEWGFFFGIDGAGYDFYSEHWIPLYKRRGLQWHDPAAEKAEEMRNKGYRIAKLGGRNVWVDKNGNFVEEAVAECATCRWRKCHQKCTCCRRNGSLKDCYEEV